MAKEDIIKRLQDENLRKETLEELQADLMSIFDEHKTQKTAIAEIDDALGNGADESLWPPGSTRAEAIKKLVRILNEEKSHATDLEEMIRLSQVKIKEARELKAELALWKHRAQTLQVMSSQHQRDNHAYEKVLIGLGQLSEKVASPIHVDYIGKAASELSGQTVVCMVCPRCNSMVIKVDELHDNGYALCPKCTDDPETWPKRWGKRDV